MPLTRPCPGCGTSFEFADELMGRRIRCKACQEIFRLTGPDETAADPKRTDAEPPQSAKAPTAATTAKPAKAPVPTPAKAPAPAAKPAATPSTSGAPKSTAPPKPKSGTGSSPSMSLPPPPPPVTAKVEDKKSSKPTVEKKSLAERLDAFSAAKGRKNEQDDDEVDELEMIDDDRPSRSRRRDDDDRDEEDDRPARGRSRGRERDDDEDDAEDDRPTRSRRRRDDDEEEHDAPLRGRSRGRDDDDGDEDDEYEDDAPKRRKIHPLLLVAPLLGIGLIGLIVVLLMARSDRKKETQQSAGDLVKAPTKKIDLEMKETDTGALAVTANGGFIGVLKKNELGSKDFLFEVYDTAASKKVGKLEYTEAEPATAIALSPNGKRVVFLESDFSGRERSMTVVNLEDGSVITRKFTPNYGKKDVFNPHSLWRAEFIGNDRLVTISTKRVVDFWKVDKTLQLDSQKSLFAHRLEERGLRNGNLGEDLPFSFARKEDHYERDVAFSSDRKMMAVWNNQGFTIVDLADANDPGMEKTRTGPVAEIGGVSEPQAVSAAFSPDGRTLASIIKYRDKLSRNEKYHLVLWETTEGKMTGNFPVASVHINGHEFAGLGWWGPNYLALVGGKVPPLLLNVKNGLPVRQVMTSRGAYQFDRNGKLHYIIGTERSKPATLYSVDPPTVDVSADGETYERIQGLSDDFVRRWWCEPEGVLKNPTRQDPPLGEKLIRKP